MLVRAECAVISGGAVRCGSKTAALIRNKILIYSNRWSCGEGSVKCASLAKSRTLLQSETKFAMA